MLKVTIVQVVYNNRKWIPAVFDAIYNQTIKDFKVVAVISGNEDGSKEYIAEHYPQTEIIDPGYNIGFAKGHNLVFSSSSSEFFQLVNPDMIMEPNYLEEMLRAFKDEKVGAATGKLYRIVDFRLQNADFKKSKVLDTTGVTISKSGRAWDRGQHEIDNGQYDNLIEVDAVSGAGCMFRATALQATHYPSSRADKSARYGASPLPTTHYEFFDEDFHSYWEDVDLAWRMKNKGWKNVFVPNAVGYHGRAAGSSEGGYFKIISFIKYHRSLPERIRQLNYKNHIFMYIKNSTWFYPQFFVREFFMLLYILLFEISTLKVVPEMFKLFPKIWKKREKLYI